MTAPARAQQPQPPVAAETPETAEMERQEALEPEADAASILQEASTALHHLRHGWADERCAAALNLWRQLEAEELQQRQSIRVPEMFLEEEPSAGSRSGQNQDLEALRALLLQRADDIDVSAPAADSDGGEETSCAQAEAEAEVFLQISALQLDQCRARRQSLEERRPATALPAAALPDLDRRAIDVLRLEVEELRLASEKEDKATENLDSSLEDTNSEEPSAVDVWAQDLRRSLFWSPTEPCKDPGPVGADIGSPRTKTQAEIQLDELLRELDEIDSLHEAFRSMASGSATR